MWEFEPWIAVILFSGVEKCEKEEEKNQEYIFCNALCRNFQNKVKVFHSEPHKVDMDKLLWREEKSGIK